MVFLITTIGAAVLLAVVLAKRMRDRREMERYSITPETLDALLASNQEVLVIDVLLVKVRYFASVVRRMPLVSHLERIASAASRMVGAAA
jgi:hypothetical protein